MQPSFKCMKRTSELVLSASNTSHLSNIFQKYVINSSNFDVMWPKVSCFIFTVWTLPWFLYDSINSPPPTPLPCFHCRKSHASLWFHDAIARWIAHPAARRSLGSNSAQHPSSAKWRLWLQLWHSDTVSWGKKLSCSVGLLNSSSVWRLLLYNFEVSH